jgi:cell division protein FtsI/penicillin-binding protein 2
MLTRRSILASMCALPLRPASLPEQSSILALERAFPQLGVSYLLFDAVNRRQIGARWDHPDQPVPLGSLVKPFIALAYAETHDSRFPVLTCDGSQCWLPRGHGRMNITSAIGQSCNAYFLALAGGVRPEALAVTTQRFGLTATLDTDPRELIGLGGRWRISPAAITRAYCDLVSHGIPDVLSGMALSARSGTGRGIGRGVYAKTGTAPCLHQPRGMGDGFAVALYPSEKPRYVLLVGAHDVPGAQAAVICGRMLAMLRGPQ